LTNRKNSQEDVPRGLVDDAIEPRFLVIGQITKPHGVRGEVRVLPRTDDAARFADLERVFIGEHDPQITVVESARLHQGMVLVKLAGCDSRNAAEQLRGQWLQILVEDALPLAENEYYLYQLEGLQVISDEGQQLGKLVDVIETKANNVFVVEGTLGQVLLPDTEEVILEIDFENGRMTVHLLPGLLP
jgi:16S rRNA processing protein RimM